LFTSQGKPFPELEIRFDGKRNDMLIGKVFEEFSQNRKDKRRKLDIDQVLDGIDMQIICLEDEIKEFCDIK
jgi:hypothetical protein